MKSSDVWARPNYKPSGSNALLMYVVYGEFKSDLEISGKQYRSAGLPKGLTLKKFNRELLPVFPFTDGPFAESVGKKRPELFARLQNVPECLVIQGEVADPADLRYLRDTVGVATFFLEHGGIAVMDPQQIKIYDPALWRAEIFEPDPPQLGRHVVILLSDDSPETRWLHTRGMRKFGRPDLSMHQVPRNLEKQVIEMIQRFILLGARGGLIREGEEIRMAGLPAGLKCHHGGSVDDPDFNNVHVEIQWGK